MQYEIVARKSGSTLIDRQRHRGSEDLLGFSDAMEVVCAERSKGSGADAAKLAEATTILPSSEPSFSIRLVWLTAGPITVKSSRSGAPIFP
jgi:hypothetical protein